MPKKKLDETSSAKDLLKRIHELADEVRHIKRSSPSGRLRSRLKQSGGQL